MKALALSVATVAAMACGLGSATAQTTEKPRDSVEEIANRLHKSSLKKQVEVMQDTLTGCRYFISRLPGGGMAHDVFGVPTIRYRADGKPDCSDVK